MNNRIINNIKSLAMDMLGNTSSECPKLSLEVANVLYILYMNHLRVNINDSKWVGRDRLVLSEGGYTTLLYATLFMAGYHIQLEDLKNYPKIDAPLSFYPIMGRIPGIDITTGVPGEGVAQAVGMSVVETKLQEQYQFKSNQLLDYHVYVLCSDADMVQGISYEAFSWAGMQSLKSLVVLHVTTSNNDSFFRDSVYHASDYMKSMGFQCFFVKDGANIKALDHILGKVRNVKKPVYIKILVNDDFLLSGKMVTKDALEGIKRQLNVPLASFYVDEEARRYFHEKIVHRADSIYTKWSEKYRKYVEVVYQGDFSKLDFSYFSFSDIHLLDRTFSFTKEKASLMEMNVEIMQEILSLIPNYIGASTLSDLSVLPNQKFFSLKEIHHNLLFLGNRVHAMGSICNGISSCGFRTFCLASEGAIDIMKSSIRMSAIMDLPITYILACNSICSGKLYGGHSSVEQVAVLRSIPNFCVYRPADAREVIGCYDVILKENKPCALILGQNDVDILPTTDAHEVRMGAYIIKKEEEKLHGILLASGTEVQLAYHLSIDLYQKNHLNVRVVSMPSMDHFLKQSLEYQMEVLPKGIRVIVLEAASSFGLERFVYSDKYCLTVSSFSVSGTKDELLQQNDFTYKRLMERILQLLK